MTDDEGSRAPADRSPSVRASRARNQPTTPAAKPGQEPGPSTQRRGDSSNASDASASMDPICVRFDAFELDEINARLMRDGQPLPVAPTPFALLCALVRQSGSLITKGALLDAVWGHRYVSDSVLKTAISELRTALGDDARQSSLHRDGVSARVSIHRSRERDAARATGRGAGHRRHPRMASSVAATRCRGCIARGTLRWPASGPSCGSPEIRASARRRWSITSSRSCATSASVVANASSSTVHGEPYLPILDALGELCRADPTASELLRTVAPFWLLQLPWLTTVEERETLRRELAGARPDRMLRELGEFFDRYTEQRPLVLVTEDLHWSDHATIQLMDYIARRRGHARLMWLATFRLAEVVAHDHPLKAVRNELRLHGLCDEIVLDPFSEEEVAAYVAQRAPSLAATESDVRALHARTDGLPLFVAQLVADLAARKSLDRADESAATLLERMAIPENLAAIIDHYIARLTLEQRSVLEAAAVCGVEFRVETLATVLEQDVASVAAICDALARALLWVSQSDEDAGDASESELPIPSRALSPGALRTDRAACAHAASSQGRCRTRTRPRGRHCGRRHGARDAFRARCRAEGCAAPLRARGRIAVAFQPGRGDAIDRTGARLRRSCGTGPGTRRARAQPLDLAWRVRYAAARDGFRGREGCASARVRVARRRSAAPGA